MCPWTPTLTPSFQQSPPPARCNASRTDHTPGTATGAECSASQPGSGACRGQPRSGPPERTARRVGCCSGRALPDYRRPVARAGADVVVGRAARAQLRSSAPQRGRRRAVLRAGPTSRSSSPLHTQPRIGSIRLRLVWAKTVWRASSPRRSCPVLSSSRPLPFCFSAIGFMV